MPDDLDRALFDQPVPAVGHHLLAGLQALLDHDLAVRCLPDHDGAGGGGVVGPYQPDEVAARPVPHRGGRNDRRRMSGLDDDPAVDEIAGPQPQRVVGEACLQLDGARGLVHLVVHQIDHAVVQHRGVVSPERHHRHMRLPECQPRLRDRGGGEREHHRDRPKLRDHHQRGVVRRVHDVALVDLPDADAALQRRADRGVVELGLRVADLRVVRGDLGAVRIDRGLLVFQLLAAGEILLRELGVAREVQDRALQVRLILEPLRLLLGKLRLVGAGIDDRQRIAGLDVLPLGEQDFDDLAVHPRFDCDGVVGLHRADPAQEDRHIVGLHARNNHRHRRGRIGLGSQWSRDGQGAGQTAQIEQESGRHDAQRDRHGTCDTPDEHSAQKEERAQARLPIGQVATLGRARPVRQIAVLFVTRSRSRGALHWARATERVPGSCPARQPRHAFARIFRH